MILKQMVLTTWAARRLPAKPNESRSLSAVIRKRQSVFFGHIIRRDAFENIVLTRNINCRKRQRQIKRNNTAWPKTVAGINSEHQKPKSVQSRGPRHPDFQPSVPTNFSGKPKCQMIHS